MASFSSWISERFRRLFPFIEVALLREENGRLEQEKLSLQDRLDAALEDRAKLWHLVQESLGEERKAYQMHVNQAWQRQFGTLPYPDAPHVPPHATLKPASGEPVGRRGRILPSEMVAQAKRTFVENQLKQ